jgi:hypothetical protein
LVELKRSNVHAKMFATRPSGASVSRDESSS